MSDVPAVSASPDPQLLAAAKTAFANAYAPYSHFHVGAALRTPDGRLFGGANVENASYGLGRCAERGFTQIVVYSDSSPPASPCGACRQVLFEFSPEAQVTCVNHLGEVVEGQVKDFLPHGFRLEH